MTADYDILPMLSRGKHRHPRRGACFMELASYLAGERWSDHPRCTHPLLAMLARAVNDFTSDAARPRLATMIPSVIGLTSDDARWDVRIALRAAQHAYPVASDGRQFGLAVAMVSGEKMLDRLDGREPGTLSQATSTALASTPRTAARARDFYGMSRPNPAGWIRNAAPGTVAMAVRGIGEAVGIDTDERLRELLADVVDECRTMAGLDVEPDETVLVPQRWSSVVRAASV